MSATTREPASRHPKKHGPPWRRLAFATAIAAVVGLVSGLVIYRVSPGRIVSLATSTWQHVSGPRGGDQTPAAPGSIVPPPQVAAYFQQLNATLTSYQTQPSDTHSTLRIIIPAIHVNAPIVERGLVQGWMVVAPGPYVTHFVYSAYPGSDGNAILYSHDGTVFRHLDSLAVNDAIYIQTPQGTLQFRVRELLIISPSNLSVLDASQTPVLTLLTCYPYMVDSSRLVIVADLVQS